MAGIWMYIKDEDRDTILRTLTACHEVAALAYFWKEVEDNTYDENDQKFFDAAKEHYESDGELEFDTQAVVSASDDGAYVMGWRWITKEEADIPEDEDEPTHECQRCHRNFRIDEVVHNDSYEDLLCNQCDREFAQETADSEAEAEAEAQAGNNDDTETSPSSPGPST
jgi:hypothetical protein